ncbi:hypothetical protein AB8Q84_29065, partial [Klebsiella quasivariicola]
AGKKSAQIREILISESAWEEMTCLFAPSLAVPVGSMDSQEAISSLCASSGYDLRVNKIFKDDVNKERARKGFSKLDDAYFY